MADCRDITKRLIAYLDGELPHHERSAITAHLATCDQCQAELERLHEAEVALHSLALCEDPPELTADLHRRLAAAARPAPFTARRWLPQAVAAAAVLALALWLWPRSQPAQRHLPQHASTIIHAPKQMESTQPERVVQTPTEPLPERTSPSRVVRAPRHRVKHLVQFAGRRLQPTTAAKLANLPPPDLAPEPEPARREPVEPVVLILGEPQAPLPSSTYEVEVTLPNGDKSEVIRNIERHPSGEPSAVTIAYRNTTL